MSSNPDNLPAWVTTPRAAPGADRGRRAAGAVLLHQSAARPGPGGGAVQRHDGGCRAAAPGPDLAGVLPEEEGQVAVRHRVHALGGVDPETGDGGPGQREG